MIANLLNGYFSPLFAHIAIIRNKNADVNGRLITPTAERLAYMDFTTAVSVFTFAMIQPMPQIHNRFLAPIKPFQPTVDYSPNQ